MADFSEGLLDLVERCILAFERDGETGLEAELATAGELAVAARAHIAALRAAGLLRPPELPESIGAWRVKQRLGSGGMGTVYLAEQSEPMTRRAAIKVIRPGMDTHEILARFAIERQALAMLDHRGIARILDAGRTADGRPYLVMDYVAGPSILRYCDERQLDTRQRLELFVLVCDAVQHAHHKGLLHRDLKPGNILVTDRDGAPFPVVIDFGVAKSVGRPLALEAHLTLPGRLLGTPEYMSPEQAGNEIDVDTRTDVYSLGVVLYELLTSTLPIDSTRLRTQDVGQVLRAAEPPTPSTRITSLGDAAVAVAAQRRTSVGTLRRALRGDLDWIVMKALERDRNRRYGMPGELAADIQRHLRNEPITAGAPGAWYRFRKFCSRHRLHVAAGTMVFGALGAGLITSTVFYQHATASAAAATDSLDAALQAVGELVQVGDSDLVAVPHLESVRRDLLQRSVAFYRRFLERDAAADPRLLSRTLDALVRLGNMQIQLGQHEDAMQRLLEVEALLATPAAARLPTDLRRAAEVDARLDRAHLLDRSTRPEEALALLHEAMPIARELAQTPATDPRAEPRLARMLAFAANLLLHRDPATAMAHVEEALAIAQRVQQRQPDDGNALASVLRIGGDRADLLRRTGKPAEALAAVASLRALRKAHPQRDAWPVALTTLTLVDILYSCEQPEEVVELVEELQGTLVKSVADYPAIVAYRTALGRAITALGNAQLMQRNFPAALAAQRRVRRDCEAGIALAPQDVALQQQLVVACMNIAIVQDEWRKFRSEWDADEVEAVLQRATAVLDALPAGEPQRVARERRLEVQGLWALLRESRGDRAGACADLQAAVAIATTLAAESPETVAYRTRLSEMQRRYVSLLLAEGRTAEALPIVEQAVALSASMQASANAKVRWRDRRRELLLLLLRARGATGDIDGAFAALAEHQAMGDEQPDDTLDWLGRQEAARALTQAAASLPATDPGRPRFLARGRELVSAALAYGPVHLERGTGHNTIAVMRGNTLLVARQLEDVAGDQAAAAGRAGEAVEAYAEAWQAGPNARGENRARDAAAQWLRCLHQAGDALGTTAAFGRIQTLFEQRADALAHLAAVATELAAASAEPAQAATVRAHAIALLSAAWTAGLPPSALQEERFVALRAEPAFVALQKAAATTDKQ